MSEPSYFQNALSNFVTDAACGGAIRHLVDIGYTLDQIVDRLDYPAPRTKVQRIMMDYLYESRMLLRKEPSEELLAPQAQFVEEQDAYGRRTMRKINIDPYSQNKMTGATESTALSQREKGADLQPFFWKELTYERRRDGKLTELLHRKCEEHGEELSYISFSVAFTDIDPNGQTEKETGNGRGGDGEGQEGTAKQAEAALACLNGRQREYLQGIRWDQPVLYHRLNQRMREIVGKLYEAGAYSGVCYFVTGREKITILP